MKKFSRLLSILLAIVIMLPGMVQASQIGPIVEAEENEELYIHRLKGKDRIRTAIDISKKAYADDSAKTVVLAGADGEVDALTATLLAGSKNAPLLFVKKNLRNGEIDHLDVKNELVRLGAENIHIVGGTGVISETVESKLKEKYKVKRTDGANRYETAVAVAKEVKGEADKGRGTDHIFLANGDILADALAIGPVSARDEIPVLLTQTNRLSGTTSKGMTSSGVKKITIVGGTGAVSQKIEDQLKTEGFEVDRVFGDNRYETAVAIADRYFKDSKKIIIANGIESADALAGGYLGALKNAPMLLTRKGGLSSASKEYIKENTNFAYVLGGVGAIEEDAFNKIEKIIEETERAADLEAAKEAAKEEIDEFELETGGMTEESVEAAEAKLAELQEAAKKAVGSLETKEEVEAYEFDASEAEELLVTIENQAAADLAAAKKAKNTEIDEFELDTEGMTEESIVAANEKLADLQEAAKEAVDASETIEEVEAYEFDASGAKDLLVKIESVRATNGTVTVIFSKKLTEVPEGLSITADNEKLKLNAEVVDGKVKITVPEIKPSTKEAIEVKYAVTLSKLTKTAKLIVPAIISPIELRTIESLEKLEDIEVEFGGEYELPKEVKISLSDKEVVKVLVEWNDKDVDVKKAGIYKVEGALDFTGVMNLEAEARETKATLNVVVLEKVLHITDLEDLIESIEYVGVSEDGLDIDQENMWTNQAARAAIEKVVSNTEKFLVGKEFDHSVNKGKILGLSTGTFNYRVDGKWIVEDPSILSIESTGSVSSTGPGYIRISYNVKLLALEQGYTELYFTDSDSNIMSTSVIKVIDPSKSEFTQEELKAEINKLEEAIKAYEEVKKSGKKLSEEEMLQKTIEAVNKAEESKSKKDIYLAKRLVDLLPEGKDKKELENRIEIIKLEIAVPVMILEYVGSNKNVEIPKFIDGEELIDGKYGDFEIEGDLGEDEIGIVESIEGYAFYEKGLTSIIIPESVKEIGAYSFAGNDLQELNIPSSISKIAPYSFYNAFRYNRDGNELIIPEGVKEIGNSVFSYNDLIDVVIPESVTKIGSYAFSSNNLKNIEIPNSITEINSNTFSHNELETIVIPESVIKIDSWAFGWNNLKSIDIPDTVKEIDSYAFTSNKLENINIPAGITKLSNGVFNKNRLKNITIPENIKQIDYHAFNLNILNSITIPDGVNIRNEILGSNNQFKDAYYSEGRVAGTYIGSQYGDWEKEVTEEELAQDNFDIAAAKATIEGTTYIASQAEAQDADAALKSAQEMVDSLELEGAEATVLSENFTEAIAGVAGNTDGTDGLYTFTVKISKGKGEQKVTEVQTMAIIATVYVPYVTLSEVKVKDMIATADEDNLTVYNVELPVGTDLSQLIETDIEVITTDSNAIVGTPIKNYNGKSWDVIVTAENGTITEKYTINVSVKEVIISGLKKTYYTPGDVLEFTIHGLRPNEDVEVGMPINTGLGEQTWANNEEIIYGMIGDEEERYWKGSTDINGDLIVKGEIQANLSSGILYITLPDYGHNIMNPIRLDVHIGPVEVKSISIKQDGQKLTTETDPNESIGTYQWMISDSKDKDFSPIEGATGKTYQVADEDKGKFIKVEFTGDGEYKGKKTSQPVLIGLAKDDDFSGAKDGEFRYIGQDEYVIIPDIIKGIPVTSYANMFEGTSVKVVKSNNKNITDMSYMFASSKSETLDLRELDTSNVINMSGMFLQNRANLLDLSNFDTWNVEDMSDMFGASKADLLDLSNFDTSNVTDMSCMFMQNQATTLDLSSFDTSNVIDMSGMFAENEKITSLDLSNFNTSNVEDMSGMFNYCDATTLDLSSFDTSNVTIMSYMFCETQIEELDLSSFDTSNVTGMDWIFSNSKVITGYAKTQDDAYKFNNSSGKPDQLTFIVKEL